MPTFFHVARRAPGVPQPTEGQIVQLQVVTPGVAVHVGPAWLVPDPLTSPAVASTYPEGLSRHGFSYIFDLPTANGQVNPNHLIEMTYELVRRAEFPHCRSRFQSVYGTATVDQARAFAQRVGTVDYDIWEVEADEAEYHDMNALSQPLNTAFLLWRARQYWDAPGPGAFLEALLTPPVRFLRLVEQVRPTPGPALAP